MIRKKLGWPGWKYEAMKYFDLSYNQISWLRQKKDPKLMQWLHDEIARRDKVKNTGILIYDKLAGITEGRGT